MKTVYLAGRTSLYNLSDYSSYQNHCFSRDDPPSSRSVEILSDDLVSIASSIPSGDSGHHRSLVILARYFPFLIFKMWRIKLKFEFLKVYLLV